MAEMSPLRRRMIEDMTIRNLSPATRQSYVHAVSKFSRYFGHSPDRLGLEDVRAYQVHLISKGISWASLNQVVCALRFFYSLASLNLWCFCESLSPRCGDGGDSWWAGRSQSRSTW